MAFRYSVELRNAGLDARIAALGPSPVLKIYSSGQQVGKPAAGELVSIQLEDGWMSKAEDGVVSNSSDWKGTDTQPTGFLAATFPSGTIANTTNITAGTITTVTNLTNAPTAGDFTSTMKTSLNAATPAVTVSDKTGFSLTAAYDPAKTAAQAGDAMTLTGVYDFAKGTVAMTESYAANGVAPSPVQALYAMQQYLMDFTISGTSYTVKKLDNATTAYVVTLNSATAPTAAART